MQCMAGKDAAWILEELGIDPKGVVRFTITFSVKEPVMLRLDRRGTSDAPDETVTETHVLSAVPWRELDPDGPSIRRILGVPDAACIEVSLNFDVEEAVTCGARFFADVLQVKDAVRLARNELMKAVSAGTEKSS